MIRIVFLFTIIGGTVAENSRKIHCPTVVNFVNKVQSSWTAHTYGYNEIDTDHFARNRLGAKLNDLESYQLAEFAQVDGTNGRALADNKNTTNQTLPESFSWVEADAEKTYGCPIDEIRDQSNCGSCWAVSVASAFSDRLCLATEGKFVTPLSANYITSCNKDNYGCDGGYMTNVYNFLKYNGIITGGEYESDEGCQPYEVRPCGYFSGHLPCSYSYAFTPKCRKLKCTNEWYPHATEKRMYKIDDWKWLRTWWNNEDSIKKEIYDNGPITAAYLVYPDFMLYKKGVYHHQFGWWPLGGHAVRVVGWGVEKGVKYWHVANSWGRNWGEDGYFKIRRGTNECLFESMLMALQANTNSTVDD